MRSHTWLSLLLLAGCAHAPAAKDDATSSLAAAERGFARDASVRTVNDAFLAAFSEIITIFRPAPIDGRTALAQRPMAATLDLKWTPMYVETSSDGSFGWDTGPSSFGQRGQPVQGYGWFVSVWRRTNGVWKLESDCGIGGSPAVPIDTAAQVASRISRVSSKDQTSLIETEHALIADYQKKFADLADDDVRVYRNGTAPTTTRAASIALVTRDSAASYAVVRVGVAGSGDLGYVLGTLNSKGGYERIYRRHANGAWKIAVDWRN